MGRWLQADSSQAPGAPPHGAASGNVHCPRGAAGGGSCGGEHQETSHPQKFDCRERAEGRREPREGTGSGRKCLRVFTLLMDVRTLSTFEGERMTPVRAGAGTQSGENTDGSGCPKPRTQGSLADLFFPLKPEGWERKGRGDLKSVT